MTEVQESSYLWGGRDEEGSLRRAQSLQLSLSCLLFSAGWEITHDFIGILFSMPEIVHYKWRGATRRARATVCWGWGGVTGNVSGEESPWLLSFLNCVIKYPFRETRVFVYSSRWVCRQQDSRNSSASFRSWVTWPEVSPGLSQVPPLSGASPWSCQSLVAFGFRSHPWKHCRGGLAVWRGGGSL